MTTTEGREVLRRQAYERLGPDGRFQGTDRYTHGTNSSYRYGCRCADCRAAHAAHVREYRLRKGMVTNPVGPKPEQTKAVRGETARHGTRHSYEILGCRCAHCLAANRQHTRDLYRRRKAERLGIPVEEVVIAPRSNRIGKPMEPAPRPATTNGRSPEPSPKVRVFPMAGQDG